MGLGSNSGEGRLKVYRPYPVGIGLRLSSRPYLQPLGVLYVGLNRPALNALSSTAMKKYGYLIQPGGSGYNASTGKTVAICPMGAKKSRW